MTRRDAVIVDAVRSPIGRRGGSLAEVHPVDLAADVLSALAARNDLDPALVDDVVWGCVNQVGDQSSNTGRMAALAAGWPESVPGTTVDRACGSSQQALHFAVGGVLAGHYDVVVAGGVESMSRVPLGSARATGQPYGPRVLARYDDVPFSQGIGAEMIAERYGFSRSQLDDFALSSHAKAAAAIDSGALVAQIAEIDTVHGRFTTDEGVRRDTSAERLAGLKPSFKPDGVIHAGNASQISDGAAALLVMSGERAQELGYAPLARFHTGVIAGDDPVVMLLGPVPATAKAIARAGLSIDDIGVYEVNEAFAPVPLAWLAETSADASRLNPLGGAIGVGHPLGASGAVLMTRMLHHMRDHGIRYGLQTMCTAGGMANATIVELLAA
ncbi:MAG TPA: thiolase family protein [Mycobacteriales bacterium]|nr:thiolase family protein [Mycobacteriales bacterium]